MEKKEPLVTAVITTYKRQPEVVRRSLRSIVEQNYSNVEIFVVNDYPADAELVERIRKVTEEFADRREIHYVVVEKNGGACRARNRALTEAKGKYFACLDDDDEWLPDKLTLQVQAAEAAPQAGIVYCNAIIRYEETGKELDKFQSVQSSGDIFRELLAKNNIGSCSYPLMRTDFLQEIGGFNAEMPALQDWEMYLRMLKKHPAVYVHDKCVIYYRYEGERISAHPENRIRAFENIHAAFSSELAAPENKKNAAGFYLMGAHFYSIGKDGKNAWKYYWKAVRLDPANVKRNGKDFFRTLGRLIISPKIV